MENKIFSFGGGNIKGYIKNAVPENNTLRMEENSIWISPALDSGSPDTVWDKAHISFQIKGNGFFRFTAVCANSDSGSGEQNPLEMLSRILADTAMSVSFINPKTAPLHTLKGRYLWFIIQAFPEKGAFANIRGIEVRCPHITFMDALPEIFARDDNGDLTSLLAMYKEVFDRLDREIVGFGGRLDPGTASGADLERLISWQGIKISHIWGEERLRSVVKQSARLIRLKGTRRALSDLFFILLGEPPEITEDRQNYSFTVTVDHRLIPSGKHYAELLGLLKDFSPAGITARLAVKNYGNAPDLDMGITLADDTFDSGFII